MTRPTITIDSGKIKTFQYLINQIQQKDSELHIPMYSLLIGAGCSYKCGIPLGGQLIEICKIYSYIKNELTGVEVYLKECDKQYDLECLRTFLMENGDEDGFKNYVASREAILKSGINRPLHLNRIKAILGDFPDERNDEVWAGFEENIVQDSSYGFWMDEFSENPLERQKFIEKIIDDKQPNGAYILLAYLIEQNVFTNLLTTNFDDLINEALIYYTDQRCRFYADDEISQYISVHSKKPNIIKVHGDYRFANMKNTETETEKLSSNIGAKLREILSQIGIIVVGYNGADHSIMNALYEIKRDKKYSLIWCGRDPNNVHWRVAQLINSTANSFFVQIDGFDEMMGKLAPKLFKKPPQQNLLIEKAKKRVNEINAFLEKFKIDFRNSDASIAEVTALEEEMDRWTLLNRADSAPTQLEKIVLLSKAIELYPDFANAYNNRGYVFYLLQNYPSALEDYNMAINLDSNMIQHYGNRGMLFYKLGNYLKAIEDFTVCIRIDPSVVATYIAIADCYAKMKLKNKAEHYLELYKTTAGANAMYLNAIANHFRQFDLLEDAEKWVRKGLEEFPNFSTLHCTLAEICAQNLDKEGFYENFETSAIHGLTIDDFDLEDSAYFDVKNDPRFLALLEKYKLQIK